MDHLIPLTHRLGDILGSIGQPHIDLPHIVVVGSQSAGKSSVLEHVVGREFLPRGTNVVTRCPIVLQLINTTRCFPEPVYQEWGEFGHLSMQKFHSFNDIKAEIQKEMNRTAGTNHGISKHPIRLKIYSPDVLDLTLVDLPGITKIPVGDQPHDIEHQIKTLIHEYISRPNSIILAVTPANIDIVNSDAIKLSREVDPAGKRTIGVLTKIDLMDPGTTALDILCNRGPYNLKFGFVGLVCRSQQDINTNKSIQDALKEEDQYFSRHSVYKNCLGRCGSARLVRILNQILVNHIKERMPFIKSKLNEIIVWTQAEMNKYGPDHESGNQILDRGNTMLRLVTRFSTDFNDLLDGTSKSLSTHEISGGARLNRIFYETFSKTLDSHSIQDTLSLHDVQIAIRNAAGTRPFLFVPQTSFELLVKQQIKHLETPALECLDLVYEELLEILESCETKELLRFPNLNNKIHQASTQFITEQLEPTRKMIQNLIRIELSYINTNHPDFANKDSVSEAKKRKDDSNGLLVVEDVGEKENMEFPVDRGIFNYFFKGVGSKSKLGPAPSGSRTEIDWDPHNLEDHEIQTIFSLVRSYFEIVKQNIRDMVPKIIMCFMVNNVKEHLQNKLVGEIYRQDMFEEYLQEDDTLVRERAECRDKLDELLRASRILGELREVYQ